MLDGNSIDQKPICDFPGCGLPARGRGAHCNGHDQQRRKGKELRPLNENRRPRGTQPRIEYDEAPCPVPGLKGPCRIFRGCDDGKGYGVVSINSKTIGVHVYVWLRDVGPIPAGEVVDHRCRVPKCCNPGHFRTVTRAVNNTENSDSPPAINKRKTHCPQNHPYDEKNTYWLKGARLCRECRRAANLLAGRARRARIASQRAAT